MIAVDLFCGVGGLSLGLQDAGIAVVAAYDFWDKAVETYNDNFDHPAFQFDLSDGEAAAKLVNKYNPDIICGGPPCQEFSQAGKRTEGAKANLTASFARIVSDLCPMWFIMENVERALQSNAYQDARKIFKDAGYGLSENVLDASLCGVPQKRKRFICVGKLNEPDGFLNQTIADCLATKPMTIRDYFGSSLTFNDYYRHPRTYARRAVFSVDEPSPTIRGVNRPIPDNYKRHTGDTADPATVSPLTFEQRARIQTFPDDFKWTGTKTAREQMIGNAVPVRLGFCIGSAVLHYSNVA